MKDASKMKGYPRDWPRERLPFVERLLLPVEKRMGGAWFAPRWREREGTILTLGFDP